MPFTPVIDKTIIASAEAACKGSRERFAAKDYSVTPDEADAYIGLIRAAKESGVNDPFATLVEKAMVAHIAHWRSAASPLAGRRLV